jgi:hypothetical protein
MWPKACSLNLHDKKTLTNKEGLVGAENGIRTRDPNLGKVMLYQLSYFRKESVGVVKMLCKSKIFPKNK